MTNKSISSLAVMGAILTTPGICQNMLNNGGFEYGLLCHNYFQLSHSGVDFTGDYTWSLSNDAHSGSYSIAMTCGGSDCLRAQITSDNIPVIGNQSYKLTVWSKCSPGDSADMFVINSLAGGAPSLACTGGWAQNQMTFQAAPGAGSLSYGFHYYGPATLLLDDVTLTYSDGTAPAHNIVFPGTRKSVVTPTALNVDGSPFLALGFYNVNYQDLPAVAATGANIIDGGSYNNTDCFNMPAGNYLDTIYQLGMKFLPEFSTAARIGATNAFPSIGQRFGPHLANVALLLDDEPDLNVGWLYIPPATLISEYNALKSTTSLPVINDLQHSHYGAVSDDTPYTPASDFLQGDPFSSDFGGVAYNANFFKSLAPQLPYWFALDNPGDSLIVPKVYYAIVNGATGAFFFSWDDFKGDPGALAACKQAFSEVSSLKDAIFAQPIDNQVTAPAGITTMSRYYQGADYILAVNPVPQTAGGFFAVQGLPAGVTVTVLNEGRFITSVAGGFSDMFSGVARHVYSIPNTTFPTVTSFKVLFGAESYELLGSTRRHLPWQITGIQVQFSSSITAASSTSLLGVAATGFSGLGSNTLTWSFAPISDASLTLSLAGSGGAAITDGSANPLGGGAGFSQLLHVLWGDFNDDALVSAQDMAAVLAASHNPYNMFADLNGDGVVNAADVLVARNRTGTVQF